MPGAVKASRHRMSVGRFLNQSDWDETGLLDGAVQRSLKSLRMTKGDVIHLVIDDTRIVKRGRKMDDVSKLWNHTHQQFAHGHTVVMAALHVRGMTLPWRFVVWQAKRWAGQSYREPTDITADLIRDFQPPQGVTVRVLFDAYYLCPTVAKACASRGFLWYSVSMKNRRLTRTGRRKSGLLKHLGPGILKHRGQKIRMQRDRGWRAMRIFTTDSTLTPQQIIEADTGRWAIEVTFEEVREHVGLESTRGRFARTILVAELCLFGLYTLVAMWFAELPEKERKEPVVRWTGSVKSTWTFSDAITLVRRQIWHNWVLESPRHAHVFHKLTTQQKHTLLELLTQAL